MNPYALWSWPWTSTLEFYQRWLDSFDEPAGMTEAGRKIFKAKHLDKIIDAAITAAYKRGEEISKIYS